MDNTKVLERKMVIIDEEEAAARVKDGMSIAIGGEVNALHPMAIIRQIIRNGVKDLTIVGSAANGLEVDLLIGAGCVKKVMCSYIGAESIAPIGPFFRATAQSGELEVWECEEGMLCAGLRAGAAMLPCELWRIGAGTSYPDVNPDIKVIEEPITGRVITVIPAISPDVALFHVGYGDAYGNIQHVGPTWSDKILAAASNMVIVELDKIISNEEIRRYPERTTLRSVDAVVRAPYGSHPYSSAGFYTLDKEHLVEYVEAANAFLRKDDRAPFEAYLAKYVYGPKTHADYLETIGIRRLISLYEY